MDPDRGARPQAKPLSRAARKAARTTRKAQQRQEEAAWQEQVDTHFSYLRHQFGFSIHTVNATRTLFLVYSSAVGAVRIDRSQSVRTPGVKVYLTQHAVNGVFPPGWHFVLLDDLLRFRAPEQYRLLQRTRGVALDQIERSLAFQAQAVRQYAFDILCGDFSVFAEVQRFIEGTP